MHSWVLTMDNVRHMVLPSNGSLDSFPTNRPDDFTTLLRTPLAVTGDIEYELALTELQYVTATPGISEVLVTYQKPKRANVLPDAIDIHLSKKNFTSVADLVEKLQKAIIKRAPTSRAGGHYVKFSYDPSTFKTTVTLVPGHSITLSESLAVVFGFEEGKITETTTSVQKSDLNRGHHNLYIFCDQTEDIVFGSGKAGLLGFASIPRITPGVPEVITKSFLDPMYVKVVDNRISRIRIYIRSENDEPGQIGVGPTVVRLAVRRKFSQ